MAHAQKPDLVFQRNGRVHLYRRGCQFSRLLAAEVCASAVIMLDRPFPIQCTTAGYPLHSPFPPSLPHPCVSVCHHIPFLLYIKFDFQKLSVQYLYHHVRQMYTLQSNLIINTTGMTNLMITLLY